MTVNQLISEYVNQRNQQPESVNDLLDFCQQQYIRGNLHIEDYYSLFKELHEQGAVSAYQDVYM
ncbi:MAG: hypothetical protein H0Z32_07295 [Bacillaceae bacterium]|nr:hypothetical protein [Bacillaceae bacterium]